MHEPIALLREMFNAAVASANPVTCIPPYLPSPPRGKTIIVGAGKAAASMARAVEENWPAPLSGLVVTRYGHAINCNRIEVLEAGHPIPDYAGVVATQKILAYVSDAGPDDLVICLTSGGGSALLCLPPPGLTLDDLQLVNKRLLVCGADIAQINCVRKHLSAIQGGRLAKLCAPAQLVSLIISDVPGDDLSVIASGPTVADETTCSDALAILDRYGISEPPHVIEFLRKGEYETPKPGDAYASSVKNIIVASAQKALESAAAIATRAGFQPIILSDSVEGEARDVALMHAAIVRQIITHEQPLNAPCVILSGGETTVTVRGPGQGGRNAEFLLALCIALKGHKRVHAIACDTDGIDGTQDNAGAYITPDSLKRAATLRIDAKYYLVKNDAYNFFAALNDLILTGPTLTNVNDFRAILIS